MGMEQRGFNGPPVSKLSTYHLPEDNNINTGMSDGCLLGLFYITALQIAPLHLIVGPPL